MPTNVPALTLARRLFSAPASTLLIQIMPTLVFLFSYLATTVFAATIYMIPGGDEYISTRAGDLPKLVVKEIGSTTYLALLYLPLLITTAFALATLGLFRKVRNRLHIPKQIASLQIDTSTLAIISLLGTLFCLWKLHSLGALDMGVLSSGDYVQKTTRRLNLLDNLGFVFFAFAYGINVIVPILAFIAYIKQGEKKQDLLLFSVTFCIFVFIITATYSKAQLLIYLILALVAFLLTKAKFKYIIVISCLSIGAFILTGYAMQSRPVPHPQVDVPTLSTAPIEIPHRVVSTESRSVMPHDIAALTEIATQVPAADSPPLGSYIGDLAASSLHRMAAATPYYVALFEDPNERCGIQGNAVRKLLRAPEPACVLPTKVFKAMYPEVDWAQGQQPAPASLSAYGESGMGWSITVMVLSGIFLGALGAIGSIGTGPLFIGFTVAACAFAYYLTQVPLVASFTYPHGLFAFMIPIALLAIPSLLEGRSATAKILSRA